MHNIITSASGITLVLWQDMIMTWWSWDGMVVVHVLIVAYQSPNLMSAELALTRTTVDAYHLRWVEHHEESGCSIKGSFGEIQMHLME